MEDLKMKPNYTLKSTVGQTLKANTSLETATKDKHYLYDFSILNNADIDDGKKQEIKAQIIKYTDIACREGMVFSPYDIYTSFGYYSGNFYVKAYPCYAEDGKRKYVIMRLVKLDVIFQERKSIYNDFKTVAEIHDRCESDYAIEELNIA
jgi:hypothetical protein